MTRRPLDPGRVRAALPGFFDPIEVHAVLPTTMARAAALARDGAPEGATVITDEQTRGRGRLGRSWQAAPGTAVLLSVVLRPPLPPDRSWLVLAVAATALADTAADLVPEWPAELKWPNDLLLGGRKVAGLLAERLAGDADRSPVVLGMGVNVSRTPPGLPPDARERAGSLAGLAGRPVRRLRVLGCWGEHFALGYRALALPGGADGAFAAWRDRLGTVGRLVAARLPDPAEPVVTGRATGVTPAGGLEVLADDGRRRVLAAADVEHLRERPHVADL